MRIFSTTSLNNLFGGQSVKAELVANAGGKSLVMLNGMPVQVDGDLKNSAALTGKLAESGVQVTVEADQTFSASPEKILSEAGLENNDKNQQLLNSLREYGVPLTPENLRKASQVAASMPDFALNRANLAAVALVLLRKLPAKSGELVRDYLSGKLKFSEIFGKMGNDMAAILKENWSAARVFENLQRLLAEQTRLPFSSSSKEAEAIEEFMSSLQLQELLSEHGEGRIENKIFFQWPLFWANQELPDTLEGETYFMDNESGEQGFCMRMLVCPPSLGEIEVAMNRLKEMLWIHFGAQSASIDHIRGILPLLKSRLNACGFEDVRLTVGKIRNLDNFFLAREEEKAFPIAEKRVDVKV